MTSRNAVALDDLSHQILTDTIEMLSHQILIDVNASQEDQAARFDSLQHFWKMLGDRRRHGRMYCRFRLAKIFAACCIEDPYADQKEGSSLPSALASWDRDRWIGVATYLKKLKEVIVRKDAQWFTDESKDIHPQRGDVNSELYQHKLSKILRLIPIQQVMSKFRWTIEKHIRSGNGGEPDVAAEDLDEFVNLMDTDIQNDDMAINALKQLFTSNDDNNGFTLVPVDQLKKILDVKPFALNKFQKHISELLRAWNMDVYGETPPTLVRLGYLPSGEEAEQEILSEDEDAVFQDAKEEFIAEDDDDEENQEVYPQTQPSSEPANIPDDDSTQQAAVNMSRKRKADDEKSPLKVNRHLENLKSVRTTLQNDFEDPLQECREIAASAVPTDKAPPSISSPKVPKTEQAAVKNINDKKPSATSIHFDDSIADSESDDEGPAPQLSAVPDRPKIKTPSKSEQVAPDPPLLDENGKKKRRRFNEDEKRAIREGVLKYGFGKWAHIKKDYAIILRNRTSVNIKDCYRTMMRNGEVNKPTDS